MSRPQIGLFTFVMLAGLPSTLSAELAPGESSLEKGDAWVQLTPAFQCASSESHAMLPLAPQRPRSETNPATESEPQTRRSFRQDHFALNALLARAQLEHPLLELAPATPVLAQVTAHRPNLLGSPPLRLAEPSSLYLLAGLGGVGLVWQCWRRYRRSSPRP